MTETSVAAAALVLILTGAVIICCYAPHEHLRSWLAACVDNARNKIDDLKAWGRKYYSKIKPKFKITLVFTQVICRFPEQFTITYPENFGIFSDHVSSAFTPSVESILRMACIRSARKDLYFMILLVDTAVPIGVVVVGSVYYAVNSQRLRKSYHDPIEMENRIRELYAFCMEVFFVFTYVLFVPCSIATLSFFDCDDLNDGASFLRVDYTTKCSTPRYELWNLYAVAMVFVYPLGIPLVYFTFLRYHRHAINPDLSGADFTPREEWRDTAVLEENEMIAVDLRAVVTKLKPMSFLFDSYKPMFYWWEVFFCLNRLVLTNMNLLLDQTDLQILITMLIVLLNEKLYSRLHPYLDRSDNTFAEIVQWSTLVILMISLLFSEHTISVTPAIGIVLIALVLCVMVIFVYTSTRNLTTMARSVRKSVKTCMPRLSSTSVASKQADDATLNEMHTNRSVFEMTLKSGSTTNRNIAVCCASPEGT